MLEFDHESSRSVNHVMGAFYCMRRSIFERVGGFDESFFLYMEDLDLSKRIYDFGCRIDYRADLVAFHKQGGTSDQIKARRLSYIMASNIIYAWKHFSRYDAAIVTGVSLLGEPVSRMARSLSQRRPADAWATLHGAAMLYASLPDVWRRARRARKHRYVGNPAAVSVASISSRGAK